VYHTSNLSEAPQPIVVPGNVEGFHVAFTLVPAVFTHDVLEVSVIAAEHSLLPGWANELIERVNPNNTMMVVAKGYRKRFISSKGALVFQIMDCKQNKSNLLLIARALILKKIRAFTKKNRVVMLRYKLKVINILVA